MTEYRIVRDGFAGYEVQARRWWLPIWLQVGINTHSSIEAAEEFARTGRKRWPQPHGVVKYLGTLPAKVDTQPKDGDALAAPLVSGAVTRSGIRPTPSSSPQTTPEDS